MNDRIDPLMRRLQFLNTEGDVPIYNPQSVQELSHSGYGALCVGVCIMACSTMYFIIGALRKNSGYPKIEFMNAGITGIAAFFYLIMFSGSGKVYEISFDAEGYIFWARYIDWLLTTPLMLFDLLTIAGSTKDDIMFVVGVDLLMIAFGFVGAFVSPTTRAVFFILAILCFGFIVMTLLQHIRYNKYGKAANKLYAKVAYLTIIVWSCYPFVWLCSEGSRIFSTTEEIIAYMILDVSSKCVFGYIIVSERNALMAIQAGVAGYNQIVEAHSAETAG